MILEESLFKVTKDLMIKEPYYGLFLMMLDKIWTKQIGTACVSKSNLGFTLKINPDFWQKLSKEHQYGLLLHELNHIAFFHLFIGKDFEDRECANIAMDMEVNQYIPSEYLPEGGITFKSFPNIHFPIKAGTKVYYDILKKSEDPDVKNCLQQLKNKNKVFTLSNGKSYNSPDHDWSEFEDISESEQDLLKVQTEYTLKEIENQIKDRGLIPGHIQQILDNFLKNEPPKFNWKGYLRRFTNRSSEVYTKKLRRKVNHRFPDNPGIKVKTKAHVLLAVDTSGSVSNEELIDFFNEIDHISKLGVQVTLIQADSIINSIEPFKRNAKIEVRGRGGTSFEPVIEYFNENRSKYSCLIYFTDGECNLKAKPLGRVLWVHSSRSNINTSLPGEKIKIN